MKEKNNELARLYAARAALSHVCRLIDGEESELASVDRIREKIRKNETNVESYAAVAKSGRRGARVAEREYERRRREYEKKSFQPFSFVMLAAVFTIVAALLFFGAPDGAWYSDMMKLSAIISAAAGFYYFVKGVIGYRRLSPVRREMKRSREARDNSDDAILEARLGTEASKRENRELKRIDRDLYPIVREHKIITEALTSHLSAVIVSRFSDILSEAELAKIDMYILLLGEGKAKTLADAKKSVSEITLPEALLSAQSAAAQKLAQTLIKDMREYEPEVISYVAAVSSATADEGAEIFSDIDRCAGKDGVSMTVAEEYMRDTLSARAFLDSFESEANVPAYVLCEKAFHLGKYANDHEIKTADVE